MKVRELLQIEIWSKETSRKIFARTLRISTRVGIVIGVLVVAIGIVLTVELRWLTPGERSTARDAVSLVDALQDFGAVNDGDFDAGLVRAKVKIQVAEDSVWTIRDSVVANSLFDYWVETKAYRKEKKDLEEARRDLPQSKWGSHSFLWNDPNRAGVSLRGAIRSQLHKILD
ncbi:MAG: hypothetical protein ABSD72_04815 [Terracidiphilus sp.]|jgi:hypothetical protein